MILAPATRVLAAVLSLGGVGILALAASGAASHEPATPVFQDDEPGYLGVTLGDGTRIDEVTPHTAAAGAGLQPGDRIVWIGGRDVETYEQLVDVLRQHPPGSEVGLVFLRGEETKKMKITLGSRGGKLERVEEEETEHDHGRVLSQEEELRRVLDELGGRGMVVVEQESGFLGINQGDGEGAVVGSVIPGTAAERAKLQAGDRIVGIDDAEIGSFEDLQKALAARPPGTPVRITVVRGDELVRSRARLGSREGGDTVADLEESEARRRIEEELRRALADVPRAVVEDAPAAPGFLGVYLDVSKDGAVVSGIVPGSAAEKARLQAGDRILSLGDRKIGTGEDLREAVAARPAGSRTELVLVRGDRMIHLELALGAREESELPVVEVPDGFFDLEIVEEPPAPLAPPGAEEGHRAEFERVLRELQERGVEHSRRWAESHEEKMQDLGHQLREHRQALEGVFEDLQRRTDREILDPRAQQRLRDELERWAQDRARVLRENAERVRRSEEERIDGLRRFLGELRESGGEGARERMRDTRRRVEDVERRFGEMLRDVEPQGRAALRDVKESLGSLRAEVEGLREELQALRRALREMRADR